MVQQQPSGRRDKRSSYFPIKLPINTLSGGVGRQAPSKRLPIEAEELVNMFCTTERSIDKRSGFTPLSDDTYSFLGINNPSTKDLWYYWFEVNKDVNYLVVIDYKATELDSEMMWVFQVTKNGFNIQATETGIDIHPACRKYITYNPGGKKARDALRAVSIGSTVLVLNTFAKAGFSSSGKTFYLGHHLDGGNLYT